MQFDKWFNAQSRLIKVILLIIPFVGWICEILIRVSALIRKASTLNIVGFIVFLIGGVIFAYVDIIFMIVTGNNILIE